MRRKTTYQGRPRIGRRWKWVSETKVGLEVGCGCRWLPKWVEVVTSSRSGRWVTQRVGSVLRMFEVEFSKAYNCAMELCTELGAKVEEYELTPNDTERAYKVAREGFKRVWDDVNACLREERVEGGEKNNATTEINMAIKGIKTNNKRMRSSSSRPKNALEKTRKRSKVSKRNLSIPEV
ncbi:hypothetical protein L6452_36828 [Arctium lappa]|uniref:Uncharacterized protein n=1 Tax=Arctium lappa TaxID=4217 RepID=A0ACB8Y213_ARCLA|nr:hypothetical protein L6452_36828 [Arctium lappa]